jgi:hypothetical protein
MELEAVLVALVVMEMDMVEVEAAQASVVRQFLFTKFDCFIYQHHYGRFNILINERILIARTHVEQVLENHIKLYFVENFVAAFLRT